MKRKRQGCVQVQMDAELLAALRDAAEREERTQSAIIRRALRKHLGIKTAEK